MIVMVFGIQFGAFWPRRKPEGFFYSQEVQGEFFRLERQDVYILMAVMLAAIAVVFIGHQKREKNLIRKYANP